MISAISTHHPTQNFHLTNSIRPTHTSSFFSPGCTFPQHISTGNLSTGTAMQQFLEFLESYHGVNGIVILSWTALCFLTYSISPSLSSFFIPSLSTTFSSQQRSVYGNRFTSFLHSIIMSILFIFYWLSPASNFSSSSSPSSPLLSTQNAIGSYEYFCMNIMIGYLYYDTLYELISALSPSFSSSSSTIKENKKKKFDPATLQILLHHLLGIISHWLIQYFHCGTGSIFLMGIYGAEMSTPFLNISWLLLELKLKNSSLFFLNGIILLFTFFWRNVLGSFILYQFYALHDQWNQSTSLSDGTINPLYDQIVFFVLLIITIFFASLNIVWTLKLLKKAFGK